MYKLIAIDIDGTLVNDNREVSKEVKETLVAAKKRGIKIVLCSGRPIAGMQEYIRELNLEEAEDYAIAHNGAYIQNTNTKEIITEFSLEYKQLVRLYELSLELQTPINYFDLDQLYTPNRKISKYTILAAYLNDMPLEYYPVDEFPKDRLIPDIMFIDEPERLTKTIERLPKSLYDEFAIAKSAPHFVEFTHRDATKGNAVKSLAAKLGIKQDEVMAIGDNWNDMTMIEYAGCGVAMGNSIPELKAIADYETFSNNENGVAHVIQKLVLDPMNV